MHRGSSRTRTAAAGLLAVLLAAGALALITNGVGAVSTFAFTRLAGANRYETAARIAANDFPNGVSTVLIARDALRAPDADALGGNYLAGIFGAPILLTRTTDLPAETEAAINSLRPANAVILGGTAAVSTTVENQLRAKGLTVARVGGPNRFATAAQIARTQGVTIGSIDGRRSVFLADADSDVSIDALSVGPASYVGRLPILLTVTTGAIPTETTDALRDLGIQQVFIAGGVAAVPQAQEDALRAAGYQTVRLAGQNRAETSVRVALDFEFPKLNFSRTHVNLARGDDSADALTGGPHGGRDAAPVLVTTGPCVIDQSLLAFFTTNAPTLANGHVFGGTSAICPDAETAYTVAARTGGTTTTTTPGVGGGGVPLPNPSATTRPELVAARIVPPVTPTAPGQVVVRFTFDEPVSPAAASVVTPTVGSELAARFHVVTFTGVRFDGTFASTGADASPVTDPDDPTSVLVRFAGVSGANAAADLALATVDVGAVTDLQAQVNPEGDAALNTVRRVAIAAGQTAAPDLLRVENFQAFLSLAPVATLGPQVDFVFDQPAFVRDVTRFRIVTTAGAEAACDTVLAGNGTERVTVRCSEFLTLVAVPVEADVARGVVTAGAVASAAGTTNPLQASDVPRRDTPRPDLVSATVLPRFTVGASDLIRFTFDAVVTSTVPSGFSVYLQNGSEISGVSAVVSGTDVFVTLPATVVGGAVGASVAAGATGAGSPSDEVALANATAAVPALGTEGPDLTAVVLERTTAGVTAVYVFDEAIAAVPTPGRLKLWASNGTQFTCTAATVGTAATTGTSTARCVAFGTAAAADVGAAVLGTVDDSAVVAADLGVTNTEAATLTSGGTGSPAS